jgi:hypothetical protein
VAPFLCAAGLKRNTMARLTLVTALAFAAIAATSLTHAASVQPAKPVVVMAGASLKLVSTRVAPPAVAAKVSASVASIDNDGDRFRYDSCGCSAP